MNPQHDDISHSPAFRIMDMWHSGQSIRQIARRMRMTYTAAANVVYKHDGYADQREHMRSMERGSEMLLRAIKDARRTA